MVVVVVGVMFFVMDWFMYLVFFIFIGLGCNYVLLAWMAASVILVIYYLDFFRNRFECIV